MKVCPNCQAPFTDNSLKFCLQCGTPLQNDLSSSKSAGNGAIIAAILGGFLLLSVVVGLLGVYIFSRENNNQPPVTTELGKNSNVVANDLPKSSPQNNQPSVEQINDNKRNPSFPTMTPNASPNNSAPRIVVSSSSVRKSDEGNFYFPNFAFDNNPSSAWCEGAKGAGVGEWLQFNFDRDVMLKQIKIQPGYFKNEKSWVKNNRLAEAALLFSDGTTRNVRLEDKMQTQTIDVGRVRTNWVKIKISDYFAGSADSEDTLISEVSFVTEP